MAREITEGLKPIKEGIENLPQAMQAPEEEMQHIGEIADKYLNEYEIPPILRDKTYGIYKKKVFIISATSKLLSLITIL